MPDIDMGRVIGFDPIIEVYEDTFESYKLQIEDATHKFITPNLRGGAPMGEKTITNVVNSHAYNPGTNEGWITWTDPTVPFSHIEIEDLLNPGEKIIVAPGVQRFKPNPGEHSYIIRTILNGRVIAEYTIETTVYETVYASNLVSVTIPMIAANLILLTFDNVVKITDASGFSIDGLDDDIEFIDQIDPKIIRLKLATRYFTQNDAYTISYDPEEGNVFQDNDEPIAPIIGHSIDNNADYSPAEFVSGQVPQAEPTTLVLVMSRAIHISNHNAFTLTGTTARITSIVSDGVTIEFSLSEPVDHSEDEPDIKVSFSGIGAHDDVGQQVESFTNRTVINNSTHRAISIEIAQISASNSRRLTVMMQGAVVMPTAAGFSLTSPNQNDLPDLSQASYTVSDGTITFSFAESLLAGKSFTVNYNGQGTLHAESNNDTIRNFSQSVINNSTDTGGIQPGSAARDLGIVVLGHAPANPQEMKQVCEMIAQTIANGQVANFADSNGRALGDYFWPNLSSSYPFTVQAGHDTGGAINLTANADLGVNGRHIGFRIVGKNSIKGKNGNNFDHVFIHMMNCPGYGSEANAAGHYMESTNINTNGYKGCKGRLYVNNLFLPGLQALGIPFNEVWLEAPARKVSKGGSSSNPGFDLIQDKLFLPTEYEMRGGQTYSNTQAEVAADQAYFEYYNSDARRIKYNGANAARWYFCASPYAGNSNDFCIVYGNGTAHISNAYSVNGFAPAFCVSASR